MQLYHTTPHHATVPFAGCPELIKDDEQYTSEEYLPNELEIVLLSAKGLRIMDKATLMNRRPKSDPYVKVTVMKKSVRTNVKKQTLTPVWNEKFELLANDPAAMVQVSGTFCRGEELVVLLACSTWC